MIAKWKPGRWNIVNKYKIVKPMQPQPPTGHVQITDPSTTTTTIDYSTITESTTTAGDVDNVPSAKPERFVTFPKVQWKQTTLERMKSLKLSGRRPNIDIDAYNRAVKAIASGNGAIKATQLPSIAIVPIETMTSNLPITTPSPATSLENQCGSTYIII